MFALLAMAGDLGGAFGPSLVGTVTQQTGDNLKLGMLAGCIFPLILILTLIRVSRYDRKNRRADTDRPYQAEQRST